jgi:pimeloyl-ACP methyl ester carboxylesterase
MKGTSFDTGRLAKRIGSSGMEWATKTRPGTDILELSKTLVRVRVSGEGGRSILFAADTPMVIEQYDVLFKALAPLGRVACFETPGCGFSFPLPAFGFTRDDYATALIELLGRLGKGPHVLAFPCWTVYQAMDVAWRRPDLIEALILMQAGCWDDALVWARGVARGFGLATLGIPFLGYRLFGTPYLGQALCAAVEPHFVDRTTRFVVYKGRDRARRALVDQFIRVGNDAFTHGACNCQASILQAYFRGSFEVGRLKQPAMLIWGGEDPSHRKSDRRGLQRHVPAAELRVIDDTGHHLEHENPLRVSEEIAHFVATLP